MLLGWLYLPPPCMANHNSSNGSVVDWENNRFSELNVIEIRLVRARHNSHRNALLSRLAALPTARLPAKGARHFLRHSAAADHGRLDRVLVQSLRNAAAIVGVHDPAKFFRVIVRISNVHHLAALPRVEV